MQALATNTTGAASGKLASHHETQAAPDLIHEHRPDPALSKAQLRVPTTRTLLSWWNPKYWSSARPTEFCYGDCVWGLESQPVPLTVVEWINVLLRREELEYTLPGEDTPYEAAKINRFRLVWQVLHLLHSFWRVTETTKSVHTYLKTPGAFGLARNVLDVTPEMIEQYILQGQREGRTPSLHRIQADKDAPELLRKAMSSLHQATASLVGSSGHRRLLQQEGVAYTLRFGPALVFLTPNLADTKQPLLLVVQGEEFRFDEDVTESYRDMVARLARDPVGQTLVFELMVRLFFVHVLGIRPELIGHRRGGARAQHADQFS